MVSDDSYVQSTLLDLGPKGKGNNSSSEASGPRSRMNTVAKKGSPSLQVPLRRRLVKTIPWLGIFN